MEPTGQGLPLFDRTRFDRQHQKSGLKSIFGILVTLQVMTTHPPNQGTMPLHQLGERCLIVLSCEGFHQLAIGQLLDSPRCDQAANVPEDGAQLRGGH
jgi:hypothetical protein